MNKAQRELKPTEETLLELADLLRELIKTMKGGNNQDGKNN